jgi:hypothetical protein
MDPPPRTTSPWRRTLAADGRGRRRGGRALLIGLELGTAAAALVGGALLAVRPDGSFLDAPLTALSGSPFRDWRPPGLLLATLVGGGFSATGIWQWRRGSHARELSVPAGLGLVCFELVAVAWIGFKPLEVVFALIGATVCVLASRPEQLGG